VECSRDGGLRSRGSARRSPLEHPAAAASAFRHPEEARHVLVVDLDEGAGLAVIDAAGLAGNVADLGAAIEEGRH